MRVQFKSSLSLEQSISPRLTNMLSRFVESLGVREILVVGPMAHLSPLHDRKHRAVLIERL